MTPYRVKSLNAATWPDFTKLVENHNGVWGGCWCMGYHAKGPGWGTSALLNKAEKGQLVAENRAHASLVYDGADCVGWCQFGPTAELPRIKSLKAYEAGLQVLPDWRITCFFVGRKHRGKGVAATALQGALDEIGRLGGGVVESYPDDWPDEKLGKGFGNNGTVGMFERRGFTRQRKIAKNRWVVVRQVEASG